MADNEQLDELNKLCKDVLKEFNDLTIRTGDEVLEFLRKVELPDKAVIYGRQDKIVALLEKVKNAEGQPNIMHLYKLTANIIGSSVREFIVQDEEIKKIIEKYKISQFYKKNKKKSGAYSNFNDKFSKAFEIYANELSETQKQEQQKLFDWHKDFGAANYNKGRFGETLGF